MSGQNGNVGNGGRETSRGWLAGWLALVMLGAVACGTETTPSSPEETSATVQEPSEPANQSTTTTTEVEAVESIPDLVAEGKLIFVTTGNFPPMTQIDPESGDVIGLSPDIGLEIATRLGLELELPTVDFVAELQGLESGLYDLADSGLWATEERQQQFLFTNPVNSVGTVAVVAADRADELADGFANVTGLKIGATAGSLQETFALEGLEGYAEYQAFPGVTEGYQAVELGIIDMAVALDGSAYYYIAQNPGRIAVVGDPVEAHPLAIALRRDATELRDIVASVLDDMYADGTLASLHKKWFGTCVAVPLDINDKEPYDIFPEGCD